MTKNMIKIMMLLISTRSIHSLKKIKCHNVGEFTKNGEEMRRTVDKECEDFEGCIAFKGSYVVDGDTCELLRKITKISSAFLFSSTFLQ